MQIFILLLIFNIEFLGFFVLFFTRFDPPGFRHAMTMAFAIDEINKNANLLPNVTLGYSLYDNCATLVIGFSAALSLVSGREEKFLLHENCLGTPPVVGIVGDSFSTFSIATSDVIGLFKMPIVSFLSCILHVLLACCIKVNVSH